MSQVTREKASGALVSLGDDLKAAATDALKKCATFLGVGLHLYGDRPLNGRVPAPRPGANGHGAGSRPPGPTGPRPAPLAGDDGGASPNATAPRIGSSTRSYDSAARRAWPRRTSRR